MAPCDVTSGSFGGGNVLQGHLLPNEVGTCAYVLLIQPATVLTTQTSSAARRRRRSTDTSAPVEYLPVAPDNTYVDAIGV